MFRVTHARQPREVMTSGDHDLALSKAGGLSEVGISSSLELFRLFRLPTIGP